MADHYDLRGRTVLITGAARGIGAGLAEEVARRGARPALVGIEAPLMQEVADRISSTHGVQTTVAEADVRDRDALKQAMDQTVDELGGIDVVVANAGIETASSVQNHDPEEFERVIDVNLIGVFNTLQLAIPHVIERRGYLLPIASLAAVSHAPGMSAYTAAKAGTEALANSLRQELADVGVSVGCGYFSFLDTDMVNQGFQRPIAAALRAELPGVVAKVYPLQPAIERLADGIENRSRTVAYPDWVRVMMRTRGLTQELTERLGGTKPATAIRSAEAKIRSENA